MIRIVFFIALFALVPQATFGAVWSAGQKAEVDPLVGAWLPTLEGELPLILHSGGRGVRGEADLEWRRFGKRKLRVETPEGVQRPALVMEGQDKLALTWKSGEVSYLRAPESFPIVPPTLEGAAVGKGKVWTHPKDYFSFTLPKGWSVEELGEEIVLINPGLKEGDTLDAIPLMGWGLLEGDDLRRSPAQLITSHEREWLAEMRKDGMKLKKATTPPERVLVDGVPGAQQEWVGSAGGKSLRMWLGAIVKGEAFLFTAVVVMDEKRDQYIPLSKQMFLSVKPTPPERNRKLERALVGRKVVSSSFIGDRLDVPDSFSWSYTFKEDGSMKYAWYMSGGYGIDMIASCSDSEWGSYEIYGKEVFIFLQSGQQVGELVLEDGVPVAMKLKGSRYRL